MTQDPAASEVITQLREAVDDLQMRVVFQEDTLQSLNEVIATQDQQMTEMREQLRFLVDKYKSVSYSLEQSQAGSADERPPHY